MGREEILKRIKEAEGEATQAKARAQAQRDELLREAKREALRLEDEMRARAEEVRTQNLRSLEEVTSKERERILAEGRGKAEELKRRGQANISKAVDLLLRKFEEEAHAKA